MEVLEDRDKVERVWEECVPGFQSARGLIRGRAVASKTSKGDMEFNGMVNFKKQEFKRLKQEWQMGNGLQAGKWG